MEERGECEASKFAAETSHVNVLRVVMAHACSQSLGSFASCLDEMFCSEDWNHDWVCCQVNI